MVIHFRTHQGRSGTTSPIVLSDFIIVKITYVYVNLVKIIKFDICKNYQGLPLREDVDTKQS